MRLKLYFFQLALHNNLFTLYFCSISMHFGEHKCELLDIYDQSPYQNAQKIKFIYSFISLSPSLLLFIQHPQIFNKTEYFIFLPNSFDIISNNILLLCCSTYSTLKCMINYND